MRLRKNSYAEVRWLARQVRPLLPLSIANFGCIIVGSALTLADPLIIKWLIDVAIPRRSLRLLLAAAAAACVAYLGSLGISSLGAVLSSIVGQKMVFRIRISLLRHVDALPAHCHGNSQVGETQYRIEQDVNRVAELSGDIVPLGMHMLVVGLMATSTMMFLNWRLTAVVLPLLPWFYLLQRKFGTRLKSAADAAQAQSGKMSAFLQEHLAGLLQLQLLNRAGSQRRKFAHLAAEGAKRQVQQRLAEVRLGVSSAALVVLGMSLILGLGGHEVMAGSLTLGGLVAFYGYVVRLFEPVTIAIDLQSRFQRVSASIRRILELAGTGSPAGGRAPAISLGKDDPPELEFRSVTFSYRQDRPVLHNLSFRITAGETVALVGLNGSGKSTVGMLAARLYEPSSGAVLVGGRDIREIGRRSLRSTVTLVPQDPILFDDTVRENLLYGNPAASAADLERVSALTQFDQVLRKLPRGFDEPLGPLGGRLSGGEKKRLALARTLLQQPRILIVDEVTSALDAPTAAGLLRGLESFREGRTLVVISHRPATILWAQRILVVEGGQVVDSGRHSDLMERCASYRAIWQSQDHMLVNTLLS
jgi:ABC-type multidrug transport system fused ATPase/permease subunit